MLGDFTGLNFSDYDGSLSFSILVDIKGFYGPPLHLTTLKKHSDRNR